MRLKINYKTTRVPNSYRMMMVSLIKNALSEYNEDLFKSLYFYEDTIKNKKSKDFVFSVFLNNFKKEENDFLVEELSLNISSPNKELIIHIYNALNRLKSYTYNNKYTLEKINIAIIQTKLIQSEYVLFKTMSPIVIRNKNGFFLDINSNEYIESLNYIVDTTLKNYRGYGLSKPLNFVPIDMKKVVLKECIKSFTKNTNKKHICINSYKGIFALIGDSKDLNDIYMLGIGFRRNQGCGMIDII